MIALAEDVEHRATLLGVAIEKGMQGIRRESIGELLRPCPVIETNEGVVGHRVADACRRQRARQPTVTVAVKLEPKRTPGRHPQVN
ncbi:MAG: hypothetical protein KDI64_02620, partial [Candidatus Accumulibacter sp.]|nr:hypothetical protein [Accumulibacter sp.]